MFSVLIFRSRTNVHYLVFHLTVADSIVSFITMPLEAVWRFTLQVRLGLYLHAHALHLVSGTETT